MWTCTDGIQIETTVESLVEGSTSFSTTQPRSGSDYSLKRGDFENEDSTKSNSMGMQLMMKRRREEFLPEKQYKDYCDEDEDCEDEEEVDGEYDEEDDEELSSMMLMVPPPVKMMKMNSSTEDEFWEREDYYSSSEETSNATTISSSPKRRYQYPSSPRTSSQSDNSLYYGSPATPAPSSSPSAFSYSSGSPTPCWQSTQTTNNRWQRTRQHYGHQQHHYHNHNNWNGQNQNQPVNSVHRVLTPVPQQQQQQQTIKCAENGKSYLDLGSGVCSNRGASGNHFLSGPSTSVRCFCDARNRWCPCGPACYRQRRLSVLNISMCKLTRYRQFSDPSLYKSVLICNTLRLIEREMDREGYFLNANSGNSFSGQQQNNSAGAANSLQSQASGATGTSQSNGAFSNFSSSPSFITLEPSPPEPPRAPTPYPQHSFSVVEEEECEDTDSGLGDDNKSINWGSVLSLSSQSDLDPLNNNDSLSELDSLSQDYEDTLPSGAFCKVQQRDVSAENDKSSSLPEDQQ